MKKLLIIGASGLTGYRLAKLSKKDYDVYGTYNDRPVNINDCEIQQLEKTDKEKTYSLIHEIKPNVIIDCSALHNVDYCETHKEETWNVNVEAPSFIAGLCKEIGGRMIYISTDYVFDGTEKLYNEKSKTNPLNYYGLSKLKAEEEIASMSKSYAIARTSLVFGWNPGEIRGEKSSSGKSMNFVIWALNKLREGQNLSIVTDQYSTPTLADNLAEFLLALANSNVNGIFNTVGRECINRYDFTLKIAEEFNIDKGLVAPVTSDKFKQVAKRPMNCCLDSSKGTNLLNVKSLSVEESLNIMKEQERKLS
jgi:dTDP-4-dehydrorhamnose reductase